MREEVGHITVGACGTELCQPDLVDAVGRGGVDHVLNVLLEVGDLAGIGVPVESDKVNVTLTGARLEEGVEPVDAHQRAGPGTVGDGWRSNLDLPGQGCDVCNVEFGGGFGIEVGLRGQVRLVDRQNVLGAAGDGG